MEVLRILLFGGILLLSTSCSEKEPSLYVGTSRIDKGLVEPSGVQVSFSELVEIENRGDKDLNISEVRASCGCVKIDYDKAVLPPGGKTFVRFDVAFPRPLFFKQVEVLLLSNDRVNPISTVHIEARPDNSAQVEPVQTDFGKLAFGKGDQKRVYLRCQTQSESIKPAISGKIECDGVIVRPVGKWDVKEKATSSGRRFFVHQMECEVAVSNKAGRGEKKTIVQIPIEGFADVGKFECRWTEAPEFEFTPEVLHFGVLKIGDARELEFRILFPQAKAQLASLSVEGEGFLLGSRMEDQESITGKIQFSAGKTGKFKGMLHLKTRDNREVAKVIAAIVF